MKNLKMLIFFMWKSIFAILIGAQIRNAAVRNMGELNYNYIFTVTPKVSDFVGSVLTTH